MQGEPRQLIESVAAAAADIILRRHPLVQTAIVRVDKPHAPIDGDFGTVGMLTLALLVCSKCSCASVACTSASGLALCPGLGHGHGSPMIALVYAAIF